MGAFLAVVPMTPSAADRIDPLTGRVLDLIRRFDALERRVAAIERGAR